MGALWVSTGDLYARSEAVSQAADGPGGAFAGALGRADGALPGAQSPAAIAGGAEALDARFDLWRAVTQQHGGDLASAASAYVAADGVGSSTITGAGSG